MRSTSKLPILNNDRYENFGTLSDSMSSPDLRDLSDKNYNFGHSNFYIGRVLRYKIKIEGILSFRNIFR